MSDMLTKLMSKVLDDYYSMYGYEPVNMEIVFADDIWEAYFDRRSGHREQLKNEMPSFNGTIAAPQTLDGKFSIIIDKQYMLDDMNSNRVSWIGTIVHELTHAIDYRDYARIIGAADYDEVLDARKHRMFQLWTEFNAKRHGYYSLRKYTFENMNDVNQLPDILNHELPGQIKYMAESYGSTDDAWQQIYTVSQFLARFPVWAELFPQQFTDDYIEQLLSTNPWMFEMYKYLNTNRDLATAIDSFNELRDILSTNFGGL